MALQRILISLVWYSSCYGNLLSLISISLKRCPTVKPIPRTAEKAGTGFSQKEKLAIYDYVVAQGQRSRASSSSSKLISEVVEDLDSSGGAKKEKGTVRTKTMSRLEMLKQMRDYKRRRQSYRAKNVHITKRSQTDIMREIIKNQMDELEAERQSSYLMRESSNELPLNRDLDKVNESSPRNNEEEVSRLVGRYREESKRKHKNMDESQRGNRSVLFCEFSHGPTRHQETEEIDRYGGIEGRDNSGDRDYEREIRRELVADRGGSILNAEKYEEMAQSGNGARTRSTSPADRSPNSQGWREYSSKYKKHRHHKKHKTRD
ncbi:U11/U12 small nuclear ribonucleoprotein 48 kDa protein [Holothuria leucospilota]|uniref:U11/U12 small nuclear ribonucleoprotein 48 kDa protein n=1 Tax=Holothuria leucospilota TaxID=206669 RepID=A0A9Q0YCQ5_HOLLE|nr:U11/U12 small nuclear ribonucleoprotein 48 kDa protein [Holothuria leucospilota]